MTGTDTMIKGGVNTTINTRHQSITVMKEYDSKIFEELRFEDYCANRKVGQQVTYYFWLWFILFFSFIY